MLKILVLYGQPTDVDAFERYYKQTHLPLAAKMPNIQRVELARVVGTPEGSRPPYHRVAELYVEDQAAWQAVTRSPEGQAAIGDIPNFASGGATVVFCEVE